MLLQSYTDPLHCSSIHPNVTFCEEPQERKFTSSGGQADFDNGVAVTVPPNTVQPGSAVEIKVQPSFAPKDTFVMPQDVQSASPTYLFTSESSSCLNREVTVTMEHHVRVSTKEEADNLLFLEADSSPKRSASDCTYQFKEVKEGRSEFIPGENKGRLTTKHVSRKFFKIGLQAKLRKWLGMFLCCTALLQFFNCDRMPVVVKRFYSYYVKQCLNHMYKYKVHSILLHSMQACWLSACASSFVNYNFFKGRNSFYTTK